MACCRHTLPSLLPSRSQPSRRALPRRPPEPIRSSSGNPNAKKGKSSDGYHPTIRTLNSRGRRVPKKSLGQHYMLNSAVNERMAELAELKEGDVVMEIGPGTGSLTSALLNAGATVLAIETDQHLVQLVRDRFSDTDRLLVLHEDFTKCDWHSHIRSILERKRPMGSDLQSAKAHVKDHGKECLDQEQVVANIPFNLSTEIIKQILPMGDIFSNVILLLQDEVALRWVNCSLRTSEYRPINIFVNFYSDPKYKFKVERRNFFPQPKIDAAVVEFKLKTADDYPPVASPKSFFSMVNSAFNGKRKMLRKSLLHLCPSSEIENALKTVGLPITSRPQELTLDDFVRLHGLIVKP